MKKLFILGLLCAGLFVACKNKEEAPAEAAPVEAAPVEAAPVEAAPADTTGMQAAPAH